MSDIQTMQLHYTSDCMKCGGRVMENKEGKEFTCECAYPEDCPVKKLAEPVSDWISVDRALPEYGGRVLVMMFDDYRQCANWFNHWVTDDKSGQVTHWQPLPPPPE